MPDQQPVEFSLIDSVEALKAIRHELELVLAALEQQVEVMTPSPATNPTPPGSPE